MMGVGFLDEWNIARVTIDGLISGRAAIIISG